MFDMKIILLGLAVFEVSPNDGLNVSLVNATKSARAFMRIVPPPPAPPVCKAGDHACAWDGTVIHEHAPWLIFDPLSLTEASRQLVRPHLGYLPESLIKQTGEENGLPLVGRWVRFEVTPQSRGLSFPERRRSLSDRKPRAIVADANGFQPLSKNGWSSAIAAEVFQQNEWFKPKKRLPWEVGDVDELLTANVKIHSGVVQALRPFRTGGKYVIWNLDQKLRTDEDYPKSLSEGVEVEIKKKNQIKILVCNLSDCTDTTRLELVFKGSLGDVNAWITNLPVEEPHTSAPMHFAWYFELMNWEAASTGKLWEYPPSGLPSLMIHGVPKGRGFKILSGGNAFCPFSQMP